VIRPGPSVGFRRNVYLGVVERETFPTRRKT
jgi:hypothetical protein